MFGRGGCVCVCVCVSGSVNAGYSPGRCATGWAGGGGLEVSHAGPLPPPAHPWRRNATQGHGFRGQWDPLRPSSVPMREPYPSHHPMGVGDPAPSRQVQNPGLRCQPVRGQLTAVWPS